MSTTLNRWAAMAIAVSLCATGIQAGTLNLNDAYNGGAPFVGDNTAWADVVESNGAAGVPAVNFYRDPHLIADTLILNPTNFRVDVTPGPNTVEVGSQLEMTVMASAGNYIDSLVFSESGAFELVGLASGIATVEAEIGYFWEVLEGTSTGMTGMGSVAFSETSAPHSGQWTLNFSFQLPQGASEVRFGFDSRLMADATSNQATSLIAKRRLDGIQVSAVVVPVPESSGLMMVIGSVCLLILRRRRR